MSQHWYILFWPARSPVVSSFEHVWNYLERRYGHPMSLNDLEARLQKTWNGISQDIIRNLDVSMPDHIASCIRARDINTEHHAGSKSPPFTSSREDRHVTLHGLMDHVAPSCSANYTRTFSDGPRKFTQWSSDEDDICSGTPSLNYHTTPTGGRLSSRQI
ncbi:hypothetical protein TNCV_2223711 [Trichonephila clavipes]|nr:hypothetical protein TNCV_2223711 [Trichonephila clavipes]